MSGKEASREGYGRGIAKAVERDKQVVALEADLGKSTKSRKVWDVDRQRWISCGISEQHMMVAAAGLASCGKKPFASTFAIFSLRGYEQVRNAIARQNIAVTVVGSHAGLITGTDGSSAQAVEDIAAYRALPNMTIIVPADSVEAEQATLALIDHPGPAYLRLTRDKTPILFDDQHTFEIGKADIMREGDKATIVACGPLVAIALEAADLLKKGGVDVEVLNMATVKPLDEDALIESAKKTGRVVTAEDHNIVGGLGGACAEVLARQHPVPMRFIGVRDTYGESGQPGELYEKYGLTKEAIVDAVKSLL